MAKLIDITGKAISGEWGTDDLVGNGVPVLRTTNFTNIGVVNFNNVVTRQIVKKSISEKLLRYGDIIIEKSGGSDKQPVGRVVFFEGENNKYLFNNFTGLLRVRDFCKWNPKYIFYSLFSNYANGGTIPFENRTTGLHNLQTDSYVNSVMIVERKIEEQTDIVTILDKVNQLINYEKKQLEDLDILVKSRFIEMFGDVEESSKRWNTVYLEKVIQSIESGWSGNGIQRNKLEGEIAVLKVSAVTKGFFIPSECKVLEDQKNIKKYIYPHKDDLLFSRANTKEMVGATVIISKDFPELILPDKLWRIRFNELANIYFIKYVLSSRSIRNKLSSEATGTSGSMYNISMQKLKQLAIPLPPTDLQNNFAAFVSKIDKSKLAIQQSLDELETLKKSLMQQYFG